MCYKNIELKTAGIKYTRGTKLHQLKSGKKEKKRKAVVKEHKTEGKLVE